MQKEKRKDGDRRNGMSGVSDKKNGFERLVGLGLCYPNMGIIDVVAWFLTFFIIM